MKDQFYFERPDSEICYKKEDLLDIMDWDDGDEVYAYEAVIERTKGIFWCKANAFCGDGTEEYCGKECKQYTPRNGKNGCCKYYTNKLYTHGNKVRIA